MEQKIFLGALLMLCACSSAKIVYLNGTEVFNGRLKSTNITTISPYKWFNISNHSGLKTDAVNRKSDAEDAEEQRLDGPLATRSARQLGLFYGQRFLVGLHILALLVGIYLMIFVVEPVAVPQHYLAQHYFGVPWGVERRTQLLNENYQVPNAKVDLDSDLLPFASENNSFEAHGKKNITNKYHLHEDAYSPYKFLLNNYTQDNTFATVRKYSTPLQKAGRPEVAKPGVSHWVAGTVSRKKPSDGKEGDKIEYKSFDRIIQNNNTSSSQAKQKKYHSAGIVESVRSLGNHQ